MSIALYRRFRPEAFNEVIGQEQVTVPLMAALRAGKINHAYLFSGPRGCGKTTSARILARTLNCHANTPENPIDTPCGVCDSCVELSRLGAGSFDVVEIDAASHGGVDAARDLRERATFTPARDRFKIFIIDEAHMVTKEGFNALLKVVEEPPPHIKFIFATTEPDKVLGTIKSRTHHYPFRLVPSEVLAPYLENLCALEGATMGPGVIPLVIKAGGGSVRDSLSVLDQLIAGSVDGAVTYERAVALLGYTPVAMLDEAVNALAEHDGAGLFQVIDRVIENGNPPQRFAEDLLQRFRDLIVVSVTGAGAADVFRDWAPDELAAAGAQAAKFDLGTLTRLGETISNGLATMVGATSPRLQLELLCARLLIPIGPEQLAARLSNLEKTIATGAIPVVAAPAPGAVVTQSATFDGGALSPRARAAARVETAAQPQVAAPVVPAPAARRAPPMPTSAPETALAPGAAQAPEPLAQPAAVAQAAPLSQAVPVAQSVPPGQGPVGPANFTLEMLKAEWSAIVASIPSPVTKSMVASSLGPVAYADGVLQIGFANETMVGRIAEPKPATILNTLLSEKLGTPVTVKGVVWSGGTPASSVADPGRRTNPASAPTARAPKPVDESWQQADAAWLAREAIPLKIPAADPVTQPALVTQPAPAMQTTATASEPNVPSPHSSPSPAATRSPAFSSSTELSSAPAASATGSPWDDDEAPPFSDDEPQNQLETEHSASAIAGPPKSTLPVSAPPVTPPVARRRTAATEDEAAPDDELADQTFLSGVPLVVEMLNGTVISEEPV